jgi:hypothetical protein
VISIPIFAIGEPAGPMMYGTTYIVRPFIEPVEERRAASRRPRRAPSSCSSGPASSFVGVQMKVRCSTRATSFGLRAVQ